MLEYFSLPKDEYKSSISDFAFILNYTSTVHLTLIQQYQLDNKSKWQADRISLWFIIKHDYCNLVKMNSGILLNFLSKCMIKPRVHSLLIPSYVVKENKIPYQMQFYPSAYESGKKQRISQRPTNYV